MKIRTCPKCGKEISIMYAGNDETRIACSCGYERIILNTTSTADETIQRFRRKYVVHAVKNGIRQDECWIEANPKNIEQFILDERNKAVAETLEELNKEVDEIINKYATDKNYTDRPEFLPWPILIEIRKALKDRLTKETE